jgi:hypothetical protein
VGKKLNFICNKGHYSFLVFDLGAVHVKEILVMYRTLVNGTIIAAFLGSKLQYVLLKTPCMPKNPFSGCKKI